MEPLKLNRIREFEQLLSFVPKLVELYHTLDGRWEPELSEQEFVAELVRQYDDDAYFFADVAPNGDLLYFIAMFPKDSVKLFFWLFYMNPAYRTQTKELLFELKAIVKADGYKVCYTSSTRKESSYERWIEKFGAEKVSITYKITL